jgi:uncharacterized membrane protein YbaN (DUF454 family)
MPERAAITQTAQPAPAVLAAPKAEAAVDSADVSLHRSTVLRTLLLGLGTLSLLLGIIGIVLPLLPTTPFLLLTAACYARSSRRFYHWLMHNRVFGRYIRDWRAGHGIPLRAKVIAITLFVTAISTSIIFFAPFLWLRLLLGAIGVVVGVHLLRLPTRRNDT